MLKAQGKEVHLANVSHADHKLATGEVLVRASTIAQSNILMKVTADTESTAQGTRPDVYFPEKRASEWFRQRLGQEVPIYMFTRTGLPGLTSGYQHLAGLLNIDLIVALGAGCESLMAGDEHDIGRPNSMINLFSIRASGIPAILACIAITADRFYGLTDASALRAIAELTEQGGYLGAISLDVGAPEVKGYMEASDHVLNCCTKFPSLYHYYIISSLHGKFGNYNTHPKLQTSKLFINPLMSQFFTFDLNSVIDRVKYRDLVEDTKTAAEFMEALEYYRSENVHLEVEEWPEQRRL
mmetsp:Transcript_10892/g.21288  ORF Transcript_10892/g.21288 Transcript_10892/m.21288 type:complete len:297 (+) Transcript_10892:2158-3048(+)